MLGCYTARVAFVFSRHVCLPTGNTTFVGNECWQCDGGLVLTSHSLKGVDYVACTGPAAFERDAVGGQSCSEMRAFGCTPGVACVEAPTIEHSEAVAGC